MGYNTEHQPPAPGSEPIRRHLRVVGADAPHAVREKIAVLYVEDDDDDIFLLGHQLAGLGSFDVDFVHASTLAEARSAIERRRFDVIFCDFWLDSETSIPLIAELKAAAGAVPVVLVSSLENDDIELIGRRAGADGFVAKADLTAASLERIFSTLLRPREGGSGAGERTDGGAAAWLRALLRSLDRVHAASALAMAEKNGEADRLADFLYEILGNSEELRADIRDKLAGLERATAAGSATARFDAIPYLAHAVRRQATRARGTAAIGFRAPILPVQIETNATLFGDLVDGFMAEAGELVEAGRPVDIGLAVGGGLMTVWLTADARVPAGTERGDIAEAAANERRFLVETLARAIGGRLAFAGDADADDLGDALARLEVPLRAR